MSERSLQYEEGVQTFVRIFRKGEAIFNWCEMNFLIFFTAFIGIYIIIEIIFRIFGLQGSRWIEELARLMLVTTTFVGSSVAVKSKSHESRADAARLRALVDALPSRWGNVLEIVSNLLCGATFLALAYFAGKWTVSLIKIKRTMDSVSFPLWPFWVVIALAFFTTGVRFLLEIVKVVKNMKSGVREHGELKEM